ncbi:MAG: PilT/PilU family type 4a pilus ATPase [Proteobacteria bacterium]|nr:PilT/PilU family type 4a pilus ATPase [Pseudomonadota bacterium]
MVIKDLLEEMVRQDASDVYITVESTPMYRVEGIVHPWGNEKLTASQTEELANSIMMEKQTIRFAEELEMNLALYYPDLGRFRVNIFRQRGCVGIVIRQIKINIKTLDDLGLPQILKDISMEKRGLVLVVGGTGTGKSTTLAAMIDYRNSNSPGHIITVEDPIEFVHPHKQSIVTQREVGMDTNSFVDALKNTMRQAPDVILIGEVRDVETMESAITFAETGHLCLGTLHANNANQSLERILNFFPEERHPQILLQLSLNLRSIISQRLIATPDGRRVAAIEILMNTPRVKDLIYKNEVGLLKETMSLCNQDGMQTFDQHIFKLYKERRISYENAIAYADSANDVRLRIKIDKVSAADKEEAFAEKDPLKLKPDIKTF